MSENMWKNGFNEIYENDYKQHTDLNNGELFI